MASYGEKPLVESLFATQLYLLSMISLSFGGDFESF
jgi:hypothetical protein